VPPQVLDRVLGVIGGQSWWSSFTGRFKAQRALVLQYEGTWEQKLQQLVRLCLHTSTLTPAPWVPRAPMASAASPLLQ
jgi:hypothetical protein